MTGPQANLLAALARLPKTTPAALASLLVFAYLLWVNAEGQVFEFDPDEGNNVIKALLVRDGYAYGAEIWTDQPPLFSYLLLPFFAVFGATMDVARGVVSGASALMVFALYETLRRNVGHLGSVVGTVLLLTSSLYVPLSVSVMIGLPSVAFLALGTSLSIEAARHGGRSRKVILLALAAGGCAGAAVGIKLFALPVVPVLFLTTLLGLHAGWTSTQAPVRIAQRLGDSIRRGTAFSAGFGLVLLLGLAPLLAEGTLSGLVDAHQVAREQAAGATDGLRALYRFEAEDRVLFGLALVGSVVAITRGTLAVLPWLGWLLLSGLALLDHSPVWPHHCLLLTMPAAALAGHGFGLSLPARTRPILVTAFRIVLPALGLTAIAASTTKPGRLEAMVHPPAWTDSEKDWQVFAEFARYAARSKMVVASRPTFAFRAGRPVPPNLAVTSWKRFRVRLLSARQVVADVAAAQPETVLFSHRWPGSVRAAVEKSIRKTHHRVKRWGYQSSDLWVSRELLSSLGESPDLDRAPGGEAESRRTDGNEP